MAAANVTPKKTVIWLATDENASNAFPHIIGDDDCECPVCKDRDKHSSIIVIQ